MPRSNTKICQTHLVGWWVSMETSLFTGPLLRVRMRSIGHRLALTDTGFAVMPRGTRIISADSCGISAWTKTVKVSVILPDESRKKYFLKVNPSSSSWIERLIPRSARQGRAHEPWPRVSSILHLPSMLWFQGWYRSQRHGGSIIMVNRKYTSS